MLDDWTAAVERIRPYSVAAAALVAVSLAVATFLQIAFGWIGVDLPFATYFPAAFAAALFAGIPAGVAVIVGAVLIVWWTFIPPRYEFGSLSATDIANLLMFSASSGCIVAATGMYRNVLQRLRERAREHDLLMKELEHRGRNTYAVVESIVRNTLVEDRQSADAIAGRVRAVSSANDLVNQSHANTVRLRALLSLEFESASPEQLRASGPDVGVSADVARQLGLVFHEMVTNAMKYGALSTPVGYVAVEWSTVGATIKLHWQERGGPTVEPPQRRGFGTVVVERSLKTLSGDISSSFEPAGYSCKIAFKHR
jgi:two-component sensor histidine kinase